ncbi:MAG: cupin domain-containing protein [Pseudomonadota bacterium]
MSEARLIQLNANLAERACLDTNEMAWEPSPSPTVWRKRLHLDGRPEAGRVTSVVRYDEGATFSSHEHPGGEEILVLRGVFSDDAGDWGPGSYLLNPEGFAHSPFSKDGCVIFVKLRQYFGANRVTLNTNAMQWTKTSELGVMHKPLFADVNHAETMSIEHLQPGTMVTREHDRGAEMFVLNGELIENRTGYTEGTWLRLPPGTVHRLETKTGCTLYVKRHHLA